MTEARDRIKQGCDPESAIEELLEESIVLPHEAPGILGRLRVEYEAS